MRVLGLTLTHKHIKWSTTAQVVLGTNRTTIVEEVDVTFEDVDVVVAGHRVVVVAKILIELVAVEITTGLRATEAKGVGPGVVRKDEMTVEVK